MPDISMCTEKNCPKSEECYRFMATPNPYRQSYIGPEWNEKGCEHFWQVKSKSEFLASIKKEDRE